MLTCLLVVKLLGFFMLTVTQKQEFEEHGYFRVSNAFSLADAIPMRELIFGELEKQCGIDRDNPTTWHSDVWPKFHGIKFDPAFDTIGGEKTSAVLNTLLGEWEVPSNWGQFVVSFPNPFEEWRVPYYLWHTDFAYDVPPDPLPGLLMIIFISDVGPKSGGTGLIAGSHRLVEKFLKDKTNEFRSTMRTVREALMISDPWLADLSSPDLPNREERFMASNSIVNGCPVKVCDLEGKTGDIVFTHPWLLHASSLNCGTAISMRRVQRIRRSRI